MTLDWTPHPDPVLDQWLAGSHTVLINALDGPLDLDAGLADATLTAYYNTFTADLDHLLDIDAGLQDIQPVDVDAGLQDAQPDTAQSTPAAPGQVFVTAPLTGYARCIATRPALDRLTTRTWFPQHELWALQIISAAIDDLRSLALTNTLKRARLHALEFASELERALDGPLGSTRWRTLVATLGIAHASALNFAVALVDGYDTPLSVARKFERDLERVRDNVVAHARTRLLGINDDLATSLADILTRADTLTSPDTNAALAELDHALTDVTGADLTDANLDGIPLEGVLWSSNTHWPIHLREQISQNSQPVGPDLYRIIDGGIGKDTFVDQRL